MTSETTKERLKAMWPRDIRGWLRFAGYALFLALLLDTAFLVLILISDAVPYLVEYLNRLYLASDSRFEKFVFSTFGVVYVGWNVAGAYWLFQRLSGRRRDREAENETPT